MMESNVAPTQENAIAKKKKKRSPGRLLGMTWTLSPVTFWLVLFFVFPLLFILVISFATRGLYGGVEYVFTIENYTRFFDPLYLKILWDSIVIAGFTTIACLVFGYPFAYIIARSPKKYRNLLLMLVIVPFWTNSLVRTYAWIVLLRTEGVINMLLMKIGIISEPLAMLYNHGAVMAGLTYTLFPFMVLPLYASIEQLDKSYLEAASDLGAKPWQAFAKITLPLTMPGIVAGCLLTFIPTLGLFFIPDLMGGSKSLLIGNLIKNQFLTARDWPFGSAASMILMILTLIFILIYLRVGGNKKGIEVI
jgi:spermidine/putrescine transport system permease protein